jgi:maltose/moltooligosaccharide transporter
MNVSLRFVHGGKICRRRAKTHNSELHLRLSHSAFTIIHHVISMKKPLLNISQILNMNFGFLGLQYSFGLQQANMSPIYSYLGAAEDKLPLLWLAGPMTGLIVQPIIGAMSDRTDTRWGRRTPYFLIGAILCSISLCFMPFSSAIWMATSTLWILDAANNVTQEPYRAFVSDKLDKSQHGLGFLTQSAFTGLGQTLSYLTPFLLINVIGITKEAKVGALPTTTWIAFLVGSVLSIVTMMWTLYTTKEIPLTDQERADIKKAPKGFGATFREIGAAIKEMPTTMRQMGLMMLFSWYAMFIYWQYIAKTVSKSLFGTTDAQSPAFRDAELLVGPLGAFYNTIAFIAAFAMMFLARRWGAKPLHAICLALAGVSMLLIPEMKSSALLYIPMIGIGLNWASMMGNPYIMLAGSVPPERTGVYMGIFNMFIVIPMLLETATIPLIYKGLLGNDPTNAMRLAGILMLLASISVLRIQVKNQSDSKVEMRGGGH